MQVPYGATPLDSDELEGLKFQHIRTRDQLNQMEQANIQNGLLWLQRRRSAEVLSIDFVRELHRRLFGDVWKWAGAYRTTGKNIGVDPYLIQTQLSKLLEDAKAWHAYQTYPAREAALRFHHKMVWIHCFPNGNGRHARIMADVILEKMYGAVPISWVSDLDSVGKMRTEYISALRAADKGDFAPLFQLYPE